MLQQVTLKGLRIPHSGFRIPDSRFLTFHKPYKNMADSKFMFHRLLPLVRYPFLQKTSSFQASYFNRIVKLWNYVCKLAPPTSFSSPTAFQLFVRKLMSTHLSRVYEINYPCTWTLVPTCPCHS